MLWSSVVFAIDWRKYLCKTPKITCIGTHQINKLETHHAGTYKYCYLCRRSVSEVSANEKLYRPRHIWNDYRPCLDRVSTDYRPTIDRYIDRVSTECRPSIDRVSTEYRPSIDRVSTEYRPTVDRLSTVCRPTIDRYIGRYVDRCLGRHYPQ